MSEATTTITDTMRSCIEQCTKCYNVCLETLAHSIRKGGEFAAAGHLQPLLDCVETCGACRDFMLRGSPLHPELCRLCAEVCERCATCCEHLADQDDQLRRCAEECTRCAEECRQMAA